MYTMRNGLDVVLPLVVAIVNVITSPVRTGACNTCVNKFNDLSPTCDTVLRITYSCVEFLINRDMGINIRRLWPHLSQIDMFRSRYIYVPIPLA